MKKIFSFMILLSLLLAMMAGCKNPNTESGALAEWETEQSLGEEQVHLPNQPADVAIETPLAVQDLTAEVAYDTGFIIMPPDEPFIRGQMDFSVELFRRAAQKERCKNTLIAPFSVSMALAMAANGADGKTAQEMLDILGGHPMQTLNAYYMNWRLALQSNKHSKLRIANSIWIRNERGFEVKEPFLAANAKYYDSQVFKVPFNEIGKQAINQWVNKKTDQMIPELLDELKPETMMVLINALALDAPWMEPYKEHQVRDGIFHSIDGKEQKAKMMASTENFYLEGDGVIGFTRSYLGGKYAFGALLPTEKSLEEYVASLDGETLLDLLKNRQATSVQAQLPKFSSGFDLSLNGILNAMGMPSAFEGGFGKMSNEELFIGEVLHKTVIDVNENGTRAAAATAVEMNKVTASMEDPKQVILDRPFLYFIYDRETNLPIFIGTLTSLR